MRESTIMATIPTPSLENQVSRHLNDFTPDNMSVVRRILAFLMLPRGMFEYVVSVDLTSAWRRHLVWSKKDGDELLRVSQRPLHMLMCITHTLVCLT
jgi:hypothetical protein